MTVRYITPEISVRLPEVAYLRRLHALGAWWCLGSSAVEPRLLLEYAPARLPDLYEAGL